VTPCRSVEIQSKFSRYVLPLFSRWKVWAPSGWANEASPPFLGVLQNVKKGRKEENIPNINTKTRISGKN
jgi:hypothetical protein